MPLLVCALSPTQPLSWRPPVDADRTLSVGSHNATTISVSRLHRSRHCSSILRPPTRPHETAERVCWCSTPDKLASTWTVQLLSSSSQPFVFVGFVVLRQSVIPELCYRQAPLFLSTPVTRCDSTTTLGKSCFGLVVRTETCSSIRRCGQHEWLWRSSVCHTCSNEFGDSSRPLWCFRANVVMNLWIRCLLRCHRSRHHVFRFQFYFPSKTKCRRKLGVHHLVLSSRSFVVSMAILADSEVRRNKLVSCFLDSVLLDWFNWIQLDTSFGFGAALHLTVPSRTPSEIIPAARKIEFESCK